MTMQPVVEHAYTAAPRPLAAAERKIRICYLLGSLQDGGTERQALELMQGLDSERFDVSLVLFEGKGAERIPVHVPSCVLGIPQESRRWLRGMTSWGRATGRLYSQFRAWRPDIVHAFLAGPSILGLLPARLARVPLFIGSRRSLLSDYRRGRRLASLADNLALRFADLNLSNCSAIAQEMGRVGRCEPGTYVTIYNGVDTERFRPGAQSHWRAALGWESNLVFGIVANFYAYKRHTDFVQAAAFILRKHPNVRFVMEGADCGAKTAVVGEITKRGLNSVVKLVDGIETQEQIFAGIDVLICPSETEGCSNVLLEAMACGKPVIATRVGGNPELVTDGESGFLVPSFSPAAIAEAAERLISDESLRIQMGECARRRAVEHFSLETMISAHERLYVQLLDRAA